MSGRALSVRSNVNSMSTAFEPHFRKEALSSQLEHSQKQREQMTYVMKDVKNDIARMRRLASEGAEASLEDEVCYVL